MSNLSYLMVVLCALLSIPIFVFLFEVIPAVAIPFLRRHSVATTSDRPAITVIVPAHNEGRSLLPTLHDIKLQLGPGDRVLVVADNCTDDTAAIAAAAGTEVVERHDTRRVGKGFALDSGLRYLEKSKPPILIIIDADCRLGAGAIDQLARSVVLSGRPAQALYLMTAPEIPHVNYQVAEFAWRVKNQVRPLGLASIGLPCQLMGTGMAFPWRVLRKVSLASGHIVEDLKLGLDLAVAGHPPVFSPSARITSNFPTSEVSAQRQRERWEHGHLDLLLRTAPKLALTALRRRDMALFAMAADLFVPPLSALTLLAVAALALSGLIAFLAGIAVPFWIAVTNFSALSLGVVIAWLAFGRDVLPVRSMIRLGPYLFWKVWTYGRFLTGARVSRWVRTDRS